MVVVMSDEQNINTRVERMLSSSLVDRKIILYVCCCNDSHL